MRLEIVGVGQMVDFNSGAMRNQLQVQDDRGNVHVINTDDYTVQELIRIATGARVSGSQPDLTQEEYDSARAELAKELAREKEALLSQVEDTPPGAEIFGGDDMQDEQPAAVEMNTSLPVDPVALRDRARKNRGKPKIKDLVQSYHDDDSGVAVHDLPADEKGNPIIPGGLPDNSMVDEEEDPGEAGQI